MNDTALKTAAYAIAEAAPRHLDQPTSPPIRWRAEGDNLVVILADGRIASGPIVDQKRDKPTPVNKSSNPPWEPELVRHVNNPALAETKEVTSLPVHPPKTSSPSRKKK